MLLKKNIPLRNIIVSALWKLFKLGSHFSRGVIPLSEGKRGSMSLNKIRMEKYKPSAK